MAEQQCSYDLLGISLNAAKMMVYLEKHNLLEIFRQLVLELAKEKPQDINGYIITNIKRIANKVHKKHAFLLIPPEFDREKLLQFMWKNFNMPTIICTKEHLRHHGDQFLIKLKKFLKKQKLDQKHLIFVNFPKNRADCLSFRKEHINPNHVIEMKPLSQRVAENGKNLECGQVPFADECSQVVQNFYKDKLQTIRIASMTDHPGTCNSGNCENLKSPHLRTVEEIGWQIVKILRNTEKNDDDIAIGEFLPRVVIFGRKGSGRRTQARTIAREFNLVYIDAQKLYLENMNNETSSGKFLKYLSETYKNSEIIMPGLVEKRILEADCLRNGWVLVAYPNDVDGFRKMDKFIVPPNKIVFLHCRERVALRRLRKVWDREISTTGSSENGCEENAERQQNMQRGLENEALDELNYFNISKRAILDYLSTKKETIHIDGNHSCKTVASNLCDRIRQQQICVGLNIRGDKHC